MSDYTYLDVGCQGVSAPLIMIDYELFLKSECSFFTVFYVT